MVNKQEQWHENPTTTPAERIACICVSIAYGKKGNTSCDTLWFSLHAMLCTVVCTDYDACVHYVYTSYVIECGTRFTGTLFTPTRSAITALIHSFRCVAFVLICIALVYIKLLHCDVHVQCSLNPQHRHCTQNTHAIGTFIHGIESLSCCGNM